MGCFRSDRRARPLRFAALWLMLAAPQFAGAQQPGAAAPALADNAALKYWQAFAQLPQWNEQQQRIIGDWASAPLDGDAQAIVDNVRGALVYLQRGSKLAGCDWSLDLSDGPALLLPHLAKARELARLAALHARRELARGHQAEAVADMSAGLALARHAGVDNVLISVLVQTAIESMFVDLAAEHLPEFNAVSLEALSKRLASLPPGGTVKSSMRQERTYFVDWFRGHLESEGASAGDRLPEMKPVLEALGTVNALAMLVRYGKFYEDAERVAELPAGEQRAAFEALERQYADNPVAKLFTPAYSRAFDVENKAKARRAMLQAAIAVQQGGREKLASMPDPFGAGEFTYRERPGGFELVSKLVIEGKPVTLVVGPRDAPVKK
ncbi:MAG: hypothetical protein U0836_15645 [Pirellulales bacterium]